MYGAVRSRLPDAANHERLDVHALDLDVDERARAHRREDFFQCRDLDPISEAILSQLPCCEVRDRSIPRWHASGIDYRIMVYNYNSVTGGVHIELDRVSTELHGALECWNRVFRKRIVRAAVRDPLGSGFVGAWAQS